MTSFEPDAIDSQIEGQISTVINSRIFQEFRPFFIDDIANFEYDEHFLDPILMLVRLKRSHQAVQ